MRSPAHVRPAGPGDLPVILQFVRELAAYEREPDAVTATVDDLRGVMFGDDPTVWALIVEHEGSPAGFALWFLNFSTWEGQVGIYLEDLYVRDEFRGLGYGRALLEALADICVERGYRRLQWAVLDWNTPSQEFYRVLGAQPMEEWTGWRLEGDALRTVARR